MRKHLFLGSLMCIAFVIMLPAMASVNNAGSGVWKLVYFEYEGESYIPEETMKEGERDDFLTINEDGTAIAEYNGEKEIWTYQYYDKTTIEFYYKRQYCAEGYAYGPQLDMLEIMVIPLSDDSPYLLWKFVEDDTGHTASAAINLLANGENGLLLTTASKIASHVYVYLSGYETLNGGGVEFSMSRISVWSEKDDGLKSIIEGIQQENNRQEESLAQEVPVPANPTPQAEEPSVLEQESDDESEPEVHLSDNTSFEPYIKYSGTYICSEYDYYLNDYLSDDKIFLMIDKDSASLIYDFPFCDGSEWTQANLSPENFNGDTLSFECFIYADDERMHSDEEYRCDRYFMTITFKEAGELDYTIELLDQGVQLRSGIPFFSGTMTRL